MSGNLYDTEAMRAARALLCYSMYFADCSSSVRVLFRQAISDPAVFISSRAYDIAAQITGYLSDEFHRARVLDQQARIASAAKDEEK